MRHCVPALLLTLAYAPAAAAQSCAEDGAGVALTAGVAAGLGAGMALGVSGLLVGLDDTRDFDFAVGAGAGIGVTVGLAGVYALIDASSNCTMAGDSGGFVWSIPIALAVVGGLLPVALWGAAEETTAPMMESEAAEPAQLRLRWRF